MRLQLLPPVRVAVGAATMRPAEVRLAQPTGLLATLASRQAVVGARAAVAMCLRLRMEKGGAAPGHRL